MVTTTALAVAPGNDEQLRAWDGDEGAFWATNADAFEAAIAGFDTEFLDAAAISRTHRVLDVGCGTGSTSRAAARRAPEGCVLGVDLSSAMLAVARRRAAEEQLSNVEFLQADAQSHGFEPGSFDVAISRTAVMFFADRMAGLANVRRTLRPGGHLAMLVWQAPPRNEWFLELTHAMAAGRSLPIPPPDAPQPFNLSDPDVVHRTLAGAGFADVAVVGLEGEMVVGADAEAGFAFASGLLGWMLDGLDDDARRRALADLRRTIDRHTTSTGVRFGASTWLVTAHR
jgi:SAM-dependent methyltransferase